MCVYVCMCECMCVYSKGLRYAPDNSVKTLKLMLLDTCQDFKQKEGGGEMGGSTGGGKGAGRDREGRK